MQKLIISLICCLLPAFTLADTIAIRDNAPDRYVVTKGDTLWDISAKFFKDPWKWPQVWGLNKDTIKNPHWIYPGDVVVLDRIAGTLNIEGKEGQVKATEEKVAGKEGIISQPISPSSGVEGAQPAGNVVKLSPTARIKKGGLDAIPSIPLADIKPFLKRPLIIEKDSLDKAPTIIGAYEGRVILGSNDIAYVKGLPDNQGLTWQVYRPGKALLDPDTQKVLGHEAMYLGTAQVQKFADISTLRITNAIEEIKAGDHLVQAGSEFPSNFVPRAPETAISARVISIVNGIFMAGQKTVIVLSKGSQEGVENGHVLALYRKGETTTYQEKAYVLPNMRYGLLFVFRTFEHVSYALVMQTTLPVELLDVAQTP